MIVRGRQGPHRHCGARRRYSTILKVRGATEANLIIARQPDHHASGGIDVVIHVIGIEASKHAAEHAVAVLCESCQCGSIFAAADI